MPISDNIRAVRLRKGLTQKQVADACGMVDATIRTYELGKAKPKPATVARIAKALGVSVAELYGVEWATGGEALDQETASALYQSLLIDQGGALPVDDPRKARLLAAFDKLNRDGQVEAIKRIEEMAFIPTYKAEEQETQRENRNLECAMQQDAELSILSLTPETKQKLLESREPYYCNDLPPDAEDED